MFRRHQQWWGKYPPPQSPNTVTLKKLDAASQANRVQYPGQTRGQKSDRLKFVVQIAPLGDAETYNWSATGIAIENGRVFVSWHSNAQANVAATRWGGAIDEINVAALENREGDAIVATSSVDGYKFNNVVAYGSNLYFPLASYATGAAVGRMAIGADEMTVLPVPGVSANAIAFNNNDLRVVTGYKGGVFELPRTAEWIAEGDNATEVNPLVEYDENFGGKYIVGNQVLRTDATEAAIVNVADGSSISLGAPLKSNNKYAESYDPATGEWTFSETGSEYYGKHTMAVADGYIYVGGGIGENGANGLRVYDTAGNLKWENGTTTTAVTVAGDFVFAATDAGLRVYKKYEEGKPLELFAFQVLNYDENGNAANGESGHPEAGIDANSCNYVAVGGGYIYLAAGQAGVYVFQLDETVDLDASLIIPAIDYEEKGVIEAGKDETEFVVPTTTPEGLKENEEFLGWSTDPDADEPEYKGGDKVPATTENPKVTLYPVIKEFVKYTLNFNGWAGKEDEITNVPVAIVQKNDNKFVIPENIPVWGERNFCGWYIEAGYKDFEDPALLKAGAEFTLPDGVTEFTLYGVWSSNMSGNTGGEEEKPVTPTPPVVGGEDSNGKG